MNDAEQDHQTSPLTPMPSPTAGAGSTELTTTSDDPAVLRALLERARERLTFYESYDRMIGENIRRTGELMLDSIAVRDEAKAQAARAERAEAEFQSKAETNRREYQALVRSFLDEVGTLRFGLDQLHTRLSAELAETDPPAAMPDHLSPTSPGRSASHSPAMQTTSEAMEAGGSPLPAHAHALGGPPVHIDLIAHGVPSAATALSLQRHLGGLDAVIGVEAREFAEGILRLHVTANRSLSGHDLEGWSDGRGLRVSQEQPRIIEIELSPGTA